jgi:hypothetical protein
MAIGLPLATGGFDFFIHHSSFYLLSGVALGGFAR